MGYAFLALIISIIASRFIQLSAFRHLTEADKTKVLSKKIMAFSQISLVFTIIIVAVFYYFIYNNKDQASYLTSVFFVFLLVQRIVVFMLIKQRMSIDDVPSAYQNKYFLAWLITTIGVASFIFLFVMQFNNGFK